MRNATQLEIGIIRGRRDWKAKLILWLFPRQINHIFNQHLSRAYEVSEINSEVLHKLAHYIGGDCGLPGYGGPPPWYLKDKHGWPIEFISGRSRFSRILCQNLRKITTLMQETR